MNTTRAFQSIEETKDGLGEQQYIANDEIATTVYLAQQLGKPLLTEGPAGVGKTELAKAIAGSLGRTLIRLQCYEGLDETKALYEWEYAKQLLYTQLLRDQLQQTLSGAGSLAEAADRLTDEEDVFFSMRFLLQRPLLQAILSDQPVVLLIDEIDRADAEFEAFLLEVLSDFQVSVPELGTLVANHRPIVVLTSNNTRELSEALKRRCLYLFIGYPSLEQELNVVRLKVPDLAPQMARQAVELVHSLRQLDLRKLPSISETLDWAQALVTLNTENLDRKTLETTLSVLLKHETDLRKVQRQLGRMDGNDGKDDGDDDDDETDWDDELRRAATQRLIRVHVAKPLECLLAKRRQDACAPRCRGESHGRTNRKIHFSLAFRRRTRQPGREHRCLLRRGKPGRPGSGYLPPQSARNPG